MAENAPVQEPTADESLYVRARLLFVAGFTALSFLNLELPRGKHDLYLFAVMLMIVAATSAVLVVNLRRGAVAKAMMWMIIPDLVAVVGFTYLLNPMGDGFFPIVVLLPTAYALIVSPRDALLVGMATMIAYAAGHLIGHSFDLVEWILFVLKAASVPVLCLMVATSVQRRRDNEEQVRQAVADKEDALDAVQQRVAELQAVSEITEIIHSSLDFERVGPVVLRILSKLIDIEACCLFVVDKDQSETLFSASIGVDVPSARGTGEAFDYGSLDAHFSCLSVFDHGDTMVLFCAAADDIVRLTSDDKLILSAIASELVVAVENSRLYKLTKKLSVTDELTGLANYRSLQGRIEEEIERSRRYDKKLSLLMIDVDDFKGYNDAYGHVAGDAALAETAHVLRASVREVDLAARYGGEEFSIVLPETDAAGAFVAAEKVREAVAENLLVDGEGKRSCAVTISIGVATYPTHARDREELLREADDALYRAKSGGKNRVRSAKSRVNAPEESTEV